jgi:hypothetical protein
VKKGRGNIGLLKTCIKINCKRLGGNLAGPGDFLDHK